LNLTQKERSLLQDQLKHEEVCIQKYQSYAQQAQDPQLKQLFNQYASQEQQHYNTINQLLGNQAQGTPQQSQARQPQLAAQGGSKQQDALLCNDMLMTEKYVSNTYDTSIFEAANSQLRQQLQHIQQEEQQHGEGIFNYMEQNAMYQPQ
jgi:spore coat protein CotF